MKSVSELINTRRYCYWLDTHNPDPDNPKQFRVSFVFEGESGHYPTGNSENLSTPWYWSEDVCAARNARLGLDEMDVCDIISSSMFVMS